ncbi:CASP-like protein [Quillaja saponaria]|uniref:CASP-like protein n=1 Tax=Quillaja saponaria TaxID=32244 RepID=A0AAD7KU60_QUISA|nr:CASP-like protein [Quillaja saponaria]
MANFEAKVEPNPILKTQKLFLGAQISLRVLAFVLTLSATWLMLTSKQSVVVVGLTFDASYSYSPAFKCFAFANAVACFFCLISLFLVFGFCCRAIDPAHYYYLFLHDLLMMSLVLAGCAAATAIGYVGRHGNSHSMWAPICNPFQKFCSKVTTSVILSYLSVISCCNFGYQPQKSSSLVRPLIISICVTERCISYLTSNEI